MIKVLHFIPNYLFGGIESLFLEWYKRIDHTTVEFELLLRSQDDDAMALEQYRSLGGKYYRLPRKKNIPAYVKSVFTFFKEHHDYDIVHAHDADAVVLSAAKKYGIRTILHSHNSQLPNDPLPKKVIVIADGWACKNGYIDYPFACSLPAAQFRFGGTVCHGRKVTMVRNAIDVKKYRFDPKMREIKRRELSLEDRFVIGHVARICHQKNQFYMLRIFKAVLGEMPDAVLLIVGGDPGDGALEKLKAYAREMGVSDSVIFLGDRDDVAQLMQAMDMFLLPSRYEGLPVTLIEAQAAGLPCLISDAVTPEADITGLVTRCSPSSDPSQWEKHFAPIRAQERKDTSPQVIEKGFDMDRETRLLLKRYRKIAGKT